LVSAGNQERTEVEKKKGLEFARTVELLSKSVVFVGD
jgi:hypothetical protein